MFGVVADHAARTLTDAHDERSWLLMATVDGDPVGTLRLTWGGDGAFPEEFVETYALDRFGAVVPPERVLVGTRFMVRADHRGGMVPFRLIEAATRFAVEHQIEVALGDCQPHLIGLHLRLGFRSYCPTYNDPHMALMVPLALVVRDLAHLDRVRSPLRACGLAGLERTEATQAVIAQLPEWSPVRSIDLHGAYDWAREVEGGTFAIRWALYRVLCVVEEKDPPSTPAILRLHALCVRVRQVDCSPPSRNGSSLRVVAAVVAAVTCWPVWRRCAIARRLSVPTSPASTAVRVTTRPGA